MDSNGWIKIIKEENLPSFTIEYWIMIKGRLTKGYYRGSDRWIIEGNDYPKTTKNHQITHYHTIQIPNPPINYYEETN
jgi:uncharacterized membrane protein YcgQ (UPF0703/DUF1980 family)